MPDPVNGFSVRGCYVISDKFHVPMSPEKEFSNFFKLIWKLDVPQKIKLFGWRCFINRFPTGDHLQLRGISFCFSIDCVCCGMESETLIHILFKCGISSLIWKEVAYWLGFVDYDFVSILSSFWRWYRFCKSKKVKYSRKWTIWLATC